MVVRDSHRIQYLSINGVILEVYDIHLLTNALESSLSTKGTEIGAHIPMSIPRNMLQLNIFSKLHVFSVNPENLKPSNFIRDPNADLAVKPTKSSESRVDAVRAVRSTHNNNMCTGFKPIHKSQQM